MPYDQFDRSSLRLYSLAERNENKNFIEQDQVRVGVPPGALSDAAKRVIHETGERMRQARDIGRPVIMAFGAHSIKNGLGPLLIRLMQEGWIQHLATNGAGVIHDWEFAFQGITGEDVRANVDIGQFGLWAETGFNINLALVLGAYDGLGYGESVGRMIECDGHDVPGRQELLGVLGEAGESADSAEKAAAAADLLAMIERFKLSKGRISVLHKWKRFSVQAAAYRLGVPFTAHPMIGHDIIYTHPLNHGAAVGRTAQRDFLAYAEGISRLDGGVYLSVGSAVMSPMIFEKSFSMSQNLALQQGRHIERHFIVVVDLAESRWDWSKGEPPMDTPDYYLRYCKTFSRMGGTMRYATADNRDFLLALCQELGVEAQD